MKKTPKKPVKKATMKPLKKKVSAKIASKPSVTKAKGILKTAAKTTDKKTLSDNATAKFDFDKMIDAYEEMKDDVIDSIGDIVENSILAVTPKASKSKSAPATAIADLSNQLLIAEKNSSKVMEKLDDIQTSVSNIKVPKPSRTFDKKENSDTIAKGLEQALISLSKKKVTKTRVASALLDELALTGVAGTNSFVDSADAPYWPTNKPKKSRARRPASKGTRRQRREVDSWEDADPLNAAGHQLAKLFKGNRQHNASSFAGEYQSSGFVEGDLEVQRDIDFDTEGADLLNLAAWKARKTIQKLKMKRVRKTQLEASPDKAMDLKAEDLVMNARKKRLGLGAGAGALWNNAPGGPAGGFDLSDLATAAAGGGVMTRYAAKARALLSKGKDFLKKGKGLALPLMAGAGAHFMDMNDAKAGGSTIGQYINTNVPGAAYLDDMAFNLTKGNAGTSWNDPRYKGTNKSFGALTKKSLAELKRDFSNEMAPNPQPGQENKVDLRVGRAIKELSKLAPDNKKNKDADYAPKWSPKSLMAAGMSGLSKIQLPDFKSKYPPLAGHGPRNRNPLPILQGTAVVAEAQKMKGMGVSISRVRELIYLGGELAKVQSKIKRLTAGSKDDTSLEMILNPLKDKEHQLIERILELKGKIAGRKVSENDSITGSSESQILKGSRGRDVLSRPTVFELPDPVISQRFGQRFGGASMPYGTYMTNGPRTASLGPVGGGGYEESSSDGRRGSSGGTDGGNGGNTDSPSSTATPTNTGFSVLGNLTPEQEQEALTQGVVRNGPQGGALGPGLLPGQGITLTATKKGYSGLGSVTAKYESGKGGVGTISSGKGDPGGVSYGRHQLSSKTIVSFLNSPQGKPYQKELQGLKPGSAAFNAKYTEIAKKAPKEFADAQQDFIKETHYEPVRKVAEQQGFDTSDPKVQEALYSMSVQHKNAAKIVKGLAPSKGADGQIKQLYDARSKYVSGLPDLSGATKNSILRRYKQEEKDVLTIKETDSQTESSTFMPKPDYTKEATKSEKSAAVTSTADDKKRGRFDDKYYESILKKYDAHPDRKGSVSNLDSETKARLGAMFRDAPESVKKELRINSAFRDKILQASLYNASGGSGMVAKNSQHSQGRAVDLGSAGSGSVGGGWNKLSPETKKWVTENSQKYGLYTPLQPKYGTRIKEDWHFEPIGNRGDWKGQPKQPKANMSEWKDPALAKNTVMKTIDTSQEKADMTGVPLKNRTIGSIRKETFGMKEGIREDRMPSIPMKPPAAKAIEPVVPTRTEEVKPPVSPIHPEVKGKPFTATSAPANRGPSTDFPVMGNDIMPPSYRKATTKAKNKPTNEAPTNSQGLTSPWFV